MSKQTNVQSIRVKQQKNSVTIEIQFNDAMRHFQSKSSCACCFRLCFSAVVRLFFWLSQTHALETQRSKTHLDYDVLCLPLLVLFQQSSIFFALAFEHVVDEFACMEALCVADNTR